MLLHLVSRLKRYVTHSIPTYLLSLTATLSLHKNHPPHIVNTVTENDEQADATKKHEGQSEAEWRVKELVKLCEHYEVMKAELVARGASRDEMQEAAQKFVADASDIVL